MFRSTIVLVTTSLLGFAGCVQDQSDEQEAPTGTSPEVSESVGEALGIIDRPRGLKMPIPEQFRGELREQVLPPSNPQAVRAARYIIYMNKDGGVYTPGINNASTNRSSIPQQTASIPAWNVPAAGWQQVMDCVRGQFAAYDVEITDIDPGDVPHFESVVAGTPGLLGLPNNVGGVSPWDPQNCSTIERSIVFTFAELYGTNYRAVCEVAAQEIAHSFGLDHEYLCEDPMTYLGGCGAKSFQDIDAQCGEGSPRPCECSATQNSVQMLTQRIGLGDAIAPSVAITAPLNNATVLPGFDVTVDAADDIGVQLVELYIDGTLVATKDAPPFSFTTDASIAMGEHTLETRAYDSKNVTSDSVAIVVGTEPSDPVDPNDPNDPSDPNPNDPSDPTNPGVGGNGGSAPSDIVGGCSTGSTGSGTTALMLLGLGLAFVLRRRR